MITLMKRLLTSNRKSEFSFLRKIVNCNFSQQSSISYKFYKTFNLPLPPKRPLNPYFKFLQSTRLAITQDKAYLKPNQVIKLVAQEWYNIDPQKKKALQEQYSIEIMSYNKDVAAYKQSLTKEQRDIIKKKKENQKFSEELTELNKKMNILGKPKKPMSSFIKFMTEQNVERNKDIRYSEWLKSIGEKWKNTPHHIKKLYEDEANQALTLHKEKLMMWKKKIISEGNNDILRKIDSLRKYKKKIN